MKVEVEDGLYTARAGVITKIEVDEDDDTRKLRVPPNAFDAVRAVQKAMRKRLGGRKPDISLIAEAMLVFSAKQDGIDEIVREHCFRVFSGEEEAFAARVERRIQELGAAPAAPGSGDLNS